MFNADIEVNGAIEKLLQDNIICNIFIIPLVYVSSYFSKSVAAVIAPVQTSHFPTPPASVFRCYFFPSLFSEIQNFFFLLYRIFNLSVWQLLTFPMTLLSISVFLKPCLPILLTFSLSSSESDVLLGGCPVKLCQHIMLNNVLRDVKTTLKKITFISTINNTENKLWETNKNAGFQCSLV